MYQRATVGTALHEQMLQPETAPKRSLDTEAPPESSSAYRSAQGSCHSSPSYAKHDSGTLPFPFLKCLKNIESKKNPNIDMGKKWNHGKHVPINHNICTSMGFLIS